MSALASLPSLLNECGYDMIHHTLGGCNVRTWDWLRFRDCLSGSTRTLWSLFSCQKPVCLEEAVELLGEELFSSLCNAEILKIDTEHVSSNFFLLPIAGMYAFLPAEDMPFGIRDNQLVALGEKGRALKGESAAVLYSDVGIECAILSRSYSEVWCVENQQNSPLCRVNIELNGADVTVTSSSRNLKDGTLDQIFCEPPCLIGLEEFGLPHFVDGGAFGEKKIQTAIEAAGAALTGDGVMDVVAIGYRDVDPLKGCFGDETYGMLEDMGLAHTTFVTTISPLRPGPGARVFNQTVKYASKFSGRPLADVARTYKQHLDSQGISQAVYFRSRIGRRTENRRRTHSVFDVSKEYYGTWCL